MGACAHLRHGVGDRGMCLCGLLGGCCQHSQVLAKGYTQMMGLHTHPTAGWFGLSADAHRHSSLHGPWVTFWDGS
jgi:hypothetical protein